MTEVPLREQIEINGVECGVSKTSTVTTALHRPAPVGGSTHHPIPRSVVATTLAVTALTAIWTPPGWLAAAVVVAVVAGLGIPHGAMDHLVAEAIDGDTSRRRFVGRYLVTIAAAALVWLIAPPVALLAFLVSSIHHFGRSDLAHLDLPSRRQRTIEWSRGLFVVGTPLAAHVTTVAPVVDRLGGVDPASSSWPVDGWWLWCALLVAQHAVVVAAVAPQLAARGVLGREALTIVTLTPLFLITDPLIGFAVYFGLWHSLAHLRVVSELLGATPGPWPVARLAAPMTAVSLGGLGVVGAGAALAGRTDLVVPAIFVFVSVLTVPHMVVVERLWRRRAAAR